MAPDLREVEVQVVGPNSMTGPASCYAGESEAGFGFEAAEGNKWVGCLVKFDTNESGEGEEAEA